MKTLIEHPISFCLILIGLSWRNEKDKTRRLALGMIRVIV